jgi:hypothetical protein
MLCTSCIVIGEGDGDMPFTRNRKSSKATVVVGVSVVLVGLVSLTTFLDARRSPAPLGGYKRALLVVVRENAGHVVFEAHEARGWISPRPGGLRAISSLLVYSPTDKEPLWQVEGKEPTRVVVSYGRVPDGFVQAIPGTGAPAPLLADHKYVVAVRGAAGSGNTDFSVQGAINAAEPRP